MKSHIQTKPVRGNMNAAGVGLILVRATNTKHGSATREKRQKDLVPAD